MTKRGGEKKKKKGGFSNIFTHSHLTPFLPITSHDTERGKKKKKKEGGKPETFSTSSSFFFLGETCNTALACPRRTKEKKRGGQHLNSYVLVFSSPLPPGGRAFPEEGALLRYRKKGKKGGGEGREGNLESVNL